MISTVVVKKNTRGGIRTPDLLVRSQTLYPTGLQAQNSLKTISTCLLYQQYKKLSSKSYKELFLQQA